MKKLLIKLAIDAIAKLVEKSIRNPKTKAIVLILISLISDIVGTLTNDISNDTEISQKLKQGLETIKTIQENE